MVATVVLAVMLVAAVTALAYQWIEDRNLERELAASTSERAAQVGEIAELEDQVAALTAEVGTLDDVTASAAACEQAATAGRELAARLDQWRQADLALWMTEEGSEEEAELATALEAEMSLLLDIGGRVTQTAEACLSATATPAS